MKNENGKLKIAMGCQSQRVWGRGFMKGIQGGGGGGKGGGGGGGVEEERDEAEEEDAGDDAGVLGIKN